MIVAVGWLYLFVVCCALFAVVRRCCFLVVVCCLCCLLLVVCCVFRVTHCLSCRCPLRVDLIYLFVFAVFGWLVVRCRLLVVC